MNLDIASARPLLRGLALSVGLALAPAAPAQDPPAEPAAAARTLNALDVSSTEGGAVRITMTLSAPAPEPVVFSVDKPARVSLDLADTKLAVPERFKRVGAGRVRSVAVAEASGRTRVVVEMSELAPYTVRQHESRRTGSRCTRILFICWRRSSIQGVFAGRATGQRTGSRWDTLLAAAKTILRTGPIDRSRKYSCCLYTGDSVSC
jgi:hypothetical protein